VLVRVGLVLFGLVLRLPLLLLLARLGLVLLLLGLLFWAFLLIRRKW